jgi:predicted RNA binding protein YcfA (HicA-like mRNA interferase family)
VFAALKRIGWKHDRTVGSHRILVREGWREYPFSFRDAEEIGPAMLAKIGKRTGLRPEDLYASTLENQVAVGQTGFNISERPAGPRSRLHDL